MDKLLTSSLLMSGIAFSNWFFISKEAIWIRLLVLLLSGFCFYGVLDIIEDDCKTKIKQRSKR